MIDPHILAPPERGDDWFGISAAPLPVAEAATWATVPSCGAVVTFTGTARDHSPGRSGVQRLEYEAYEHIANERLAAVGAELRERWSDAGRVVALHRTGPLEVTEAAVVVVVSAPHRDAAFEAARFGIDAVKASVPIWKRETWADGEDWGLEAQHLVDPSAVAATGTLADGSARA